MQKRKIKCPNCHNTFEVTNPNGAEQLIVACPTPSCSSRLRVTFATGETVLTRSKEPDKSSGYILFDGRKYSLLHEGVNTVGREADTSEADVQLPFPEEIRYVSRIHFAIEQICLKKGKTKFVICDLRDAQKIEKKPTLVNGEKLDKIDKIVLSHGDTIEIGEFKMTFNINR